MTEEYEDTMPVASEQDMPATTDSNSMLFNPRAFEQAKQVAQMFAKSQLVPAHLQGKPADCFLAMTIANELGVNALLVMQNIVIIHGTAGWKAQWIIGRANRSGVFKGPISFDSYHDEKRGLTVVAKGVVAETGEVKTASADMAMAQAEGWSKNPKYQSMPEQMLSYRAASFLVRKYCPEVLMGYQTMEELEDMKAAGQLRDVPSEGNTATEALSRLTPAEPQGMEETPATEDDSGSDEESEAIEAEETEVASEEPPQEPTTGVNLYDASGAALGTYQKQGAWLNALLKKVEGVDADTVQKLLDANEGTLSRIRSGGHYAEKIQWLDEKVQALTWVEDYNAEAGETDDAILGEIQNDLEQLVKDGDTETIRQRISRAAEISDPGVREDVMTELDEALQNAQT